MNFATLPVILITTWVYFNVVEGDDDYADDDPTTAKKFPYFVLIVPIDNVLYDVCGGSLITTKHVLTTMSCLDKESSYTSKTEGTLYFGLRNMSHQSYVHSQSYNKMIGHVSRFDWCQLGQFALVVVEPAVKLTSSIKLIRLQSENLNDKPGSVAYAIGFGSNYDAYDPQKRSDLVMSVKLKEEDVSICKNDILNFYDDFYFLKGEASCYKKDDTSKYCHNDIASPLVIYDSEKKQLHLKGITAFYPEECPFDPRISLYFLNVHYRHKDIISKY